MVSEEQTKELAYSIWEREGCPEGKDAEHYYRAKKMLEEQATALLATYEPIAPAAPFQSPSTPRPVERHTGKRRSKKV